MIEEYRKIYADNCGDSHPNIKLKQIQIKNKINVL